MSDFENILIDTTTKLMKEHSTKEVINEAEQGVFPKQLWNELEEMGMTKVAIPEEAGGTGFSFKDALNILRISGEYAAPIPLAETYVGNWFLHELGMNVVDGSLTVASPKHIESIIFSEQAAGWTINGSTKHVPFARYADKVLVTGKSDKNGELMVAVVDTNEVSVTPGINLAGEARDEISFDNLQINTERSKPINEENIKFLNNLYTLSRVVLMAGALEHTLDLTIQYANERKQFGRPIGKFQAVKQQLAVLAGHVSSASIVADYAVEALNNEQDITNEVAIAKIRIGEATEIATSIAHQVHAAIGFTHEHPLHHSTRRLWSWRDECGNESEWANYLGKYILNESTDPVWNFITSSKLKAETSSNIN